MKNAVVYVSDLNDIYIKHSVQSVRVCNPDLDIYVVTNHSNKKRKCHKELIGKLTKCWKAKMVYVNANKFLTPYLDLNKLETARSTVKEEYRFNNIVYCKFLIPFMEAFQEKYAKILLLDSDTICLRELDSLFEIKQSNFISGFYSDPRTLSKSVQTRYDKISREVKTPPSENYVNVGMLMFDNNATQEQKNQFIKEVSNMTDVVLNNEAFRGAKTFDEIYFNAYIHHDFLDGKVYAVRTLESADDDTYIVHIWGKDMKPLRHGYMYALSYAMSKYFGCSFNNIRKVVNKNQK